MFQVIRESAHLFENPTNQMGYGIPNFEDAYNALLILGAEDQFLEQNFAIYPNPVTDYVTVSFPVASEVALLKIYNVLGNLVLERSIAASENRIDLSAFTSGMYIATLEADGISNAFKIVKR